MNRRTLLSFASLAPLYSLACSPRAFANYTVTTPAGAEALRQDWKKLLNPKADIAADAAPLQLTDAQWEAKLSPMAYRVLRHAGTEVPGTSPLYTEKRDGVYACAGCSLPAYTSAMKFDSGTGWPSFVTSVPGALTMGVGSKSVFVGLEVHCAKCGGHHGHRHH